MENKGFSLFYQPKVDFKSKKITGVEALLRWNFSRGRVHIARRFYSNSRGKWI
ncbi:EAL domain-containing protein [Alkalihalobacillus deserti]|uniref:EAL domain-containing protein n=1 Tax=Alkalihalobacillus deserti TaxID=2879466 RepID=UPI001D13E775